MFVFLGIGSNMGDRLVNLGTALGRLDALPDVTLLCVSHAYESEAWPSPEDPPYANAVALIDTPTLLPELLVRLKEIERGMGRDLAAPRNSPRPIDLDILIAETDEWDRPDLKVPHPRIAERDFVVTPLLELDPDMRYPDGTPVTRGGIRVGRITSVLGVIPGFEVRTPAGDARERPPVPPTPDRVRTALPGEEWAEVYRRTADRPMVGMRLMFGAPQSSLDASFAEVILAQDGVPFAWDPYPPEEGTDPYNLSRPFRLLVPASMAEHARRLLDDAAQAPFDWSEAEELAEQAEEQGPYPDEDEL